VVPARQRFRADDRAGRIDLTLIIRRKLLALDPLAHAGFQGHARVHGIAHRGVEHTHGAATRILGLVHRQVGPLHDVVGGVVGLAEQRDADAGGRVALVIAEFIRACQARPDLGTDLLRLLDCLRLARAELAGDNRELVAAEAGDRVAVAQTIGQPRGDGLQHAVTDIVAQRVVQCLEMVQIEKQHGAVLPGACAGGDGVMEAIHQQAPVGQMRERVVEREEFDLRLGTLAIRDVAEVDRQALRGGIGIDLEPAFAAWVVVFERGCAILRHRAAELALDLAASQFRACIPHDVTQ